MIDAMARQRSPLTSVNKQSIAVRHVTGIRLFIQRSETVDHATVQKVESKYTCLSSLKSAQYYHKYSFNSNVLCSRMGFIFCHCGNSWKKGHGYLWTRCIVGQTNFLPPEIKFGADKQQPTTPRTKCTMKNEWEKIVVRNPAN